MLRPRADHILEEGDADAVDAADLVERLGGPGAILDHLGEQGQPHADDPPPLRELVDGLVEELVLILAHRVGIVGERAVPPAERGEDGAGVLAVEEIDGGHVPLAR